MKFYYIMGLLGLFSFTHVNAQQWFTSTTHTLDSLVYGDMSWGDYDNDGDQDLLLLGARESGTLKTILLKNENNAFSPVPTPFFDAQQGAADFVDFDNDNDLDVFITGTNSSYTAQSAGYINNNGIYTAVATGIKALNQAATAWADFDNDGDQDLFVCGTNTSYTSESILYENKGDTFIAKTTTITGITGGSADWADIDLDGDFDLIISGMDNNGGEISKLYINNNGSSFTASTQSFLPVTSSAVRFMDYNMDGYQDLTLMGSDVNGNQKVIIYKNTNGTFTQHQQISDIVSSTNRNPMAWGDIDGDGDPDLIVSGSDDNSDYICKVFRNNAGNFVALSNAGLPMVGGNSSVAFYDFDNDNDLDFTLSGQNNSTVEAAPTKIYRNDSATANTVPQTPTGIVRTVNGQSVDLKWNRATDNETSSKGLTYNVALRNVSTSDWVISPLSLTSGKRMITAKGNVEGDTNISFSNLPYGKYQWTVQSIDNNFAPSSFSPVDSFIISDLVPFHLLSPANMHNVTLDQTALPFSFMWNKNDSAVSYRYQLYKSSDLSQPIHASLSNANGNDTVYTMTRQDFFNKCIQAGQFPGTTNTYKWLAIAKGKYDSIISMDTFSIVVKLNKTLAEFVLIDPDNNEDKSIETDEDDQLKFKWQASKGATKYRWQMTKHSDPSFAQIILNFNSDNNGVDTTYSVREDSLSKWLMNAGHQANTKQKYLWRAIAYNTNDSLISKTDFTLEIEIEKKGTGIHSINKNELITVYPSPFNNELTIMNNSKQLIEEVTLVNNNGQLILSAKNVQPAELQKIETQNLVKGVYYLFYKINDTYYSITLIKQ